MLARSLLSAVLMAFAGTACAHRPTVQECREAGEFIRNAALSRDAGMPRATFVERLHGDLTAIRGHPPELRWFAQDEEDEVFLIAAVEKVFDRPMTSSEHEADMLRTCLARMGTAGGSVQEIRAERLGGPLYTGGVHIQMRAQPGARRDQGDYSVSL